MSYPRAVPVIGGARRSAHRFRPLSVVPGRQDWFLNEVTSSFGLGTSLDATPCDAAPDKRHSTRPTDVCFPNSRLRAPVLAGSRCVHDACASCGAMGFGAHRVAGGVDVHSVRSPLRRTAFASVRGLQPCAGILSPARPMRSTSDVRVASLASVFVGPVVTPSRGSSRARAAEVRSATAL
jgi:hypothetical protein